MEVRLTKWSYVPREVRSLQFSPNLSFPRTREPISHDQARGLMGFHACAEKTALEI